MSASILWEPVDPSPGSIGCWAPSWFMETMERAGMGLPCTLGHDDVPKLAAMAATMKKGEAPNPFEEIIKKIDLHGKISLWAEH